MFCSVVCCGLALVATALIACVTIAPIVWSLLDTEDVAVVAANANCGMEVASDALAAAVVKMGELSEAIVVGFAFAREPKGRKLVCALAVD